MVHLGLAFAADFTRKLFKNSPFEIFVCIAAAAVPTPLFRSQRFAVRAVVSSMAGAAIALLSWPVVFSATFAAGWHLFT